MIDGEISDVYGRSMLLIIGITILILALVLFGKPESSDGMLVAATLSILAMGIISPTVNAWTIDLSNPSTIGKTIAKIYVALEAAIGLGALFSGWYYQDVLEKIPMIFYVCAFFAFLGFIYMLFYKKK